MPTKNEDEVTKLDEFTKILNTMHSVVTLFGCSYKYPAGVKCTYVTKDNQDNPDCLIGQVLYRLGVSIDTLRELDNRCGSISNSLSSTLRTKLSIITYDDTILVLQAAQSIQDLNLTWGEALQAAKVKAREILIP